MYLILVILNVDYKSKPIETLQNMFIVVLFTIAKYWKQPKCPSVNEWIKKLWYIYTLEFFVADRKEELLPFATAWMELESLMPSEISQMVKDKYHMISLTSGTSSAKQKKMSKIEPETWK